MNVISVAILIVSLLDSITASAISCPPGVMPLTGALFVEPGTSRVHAIGYCDANVAPTDYFYVISTNGGVDYYAAPLAFPSSIIVDGPMGIIVSGKYTVIAGRQPAGTNVTVAVSVNKGAFAAVVLPYYTNPDALTVTDKGVFLIGDELSAVYASSTPDVASSWTKSNVGPPKPWSAISGFAQNASGTLLAVGTVPVGFDNFGMVFAFDRSVNWWLPLPTFPASVDPLEAIATNGTAIVVSGSRLIMSSFDGGATWSTTHTIKKGDIWGVSFDAATGLWSAAGESTVFISTDAVQWTATHLPGQQLVFLTAASNGTLLAGGGGPTPLLVSLSKGAKWMPARIH